MIKWTDQSPAVRFQPRERLRFELPADALPAVLVPTAVRVAVRAHLETRSEELGGLLVGEVFGEVFGEEHPAAIRIVACVPSHEYSSTGVSLRMASDVWSRARALLIAERLIVGWYHSHPGLTAFFSETDRRTQRAFFPHTYSLGWVIDPTDGDERFYLGADALEIDPRRVYSG